MKNLKRRFPFFFQTGCPSPSTNVFGFELSCNQHCYCRGMRIEHDEEAQPLQKARCLPVMAKKVVKLILRIDAKVCKSFEKYNRSNKMLVTKHIQFWKGLEHIWRLCCYKNTRLWSPNLGVNPMNPIQSLQLESNFSPHFSPRHSLLAQSKSLPQGDRSAFTGSASHSSFPMFSESLKTNLRRIRFVCFCGTGKPAFLLVWLRYRYFCCRIYESRSSKDIRSSSWKSPRLWIWKMSLSYKSSPTWKEL